MKSKVWGRNALAFALIAGLGIGSASAQSLVASETTAVFNTNDHVATVVFTNAPLDDGDTSNDVGAFDFELSYNDANLTITTPDITTDSAGTACSVPVPGTILCFANPTVGLTLPATVTISMAFDIGGTVGVEPLAISNVNAFLSEGGGAAAVPATDGSIEIIDAPPDLELVFVPAAGSTITFPTGGDAGTTETSDIDVSVTGAAGSATVSGCATTGAAFSVVPGDLTLGAGDTGTITVECTVPASGDATGSLTCNTEDDVNGAGTASWDLSCAEGNPVPIAEYSSNPAPGGDLPSCDGAPGSTQTTSLTISNTGNAGAGSEFDYTCSTASPGFTVTGGATDTLAVGESAVVTVECTVPAEDAPANTGTLDCTSTAPNQPTAAYGLSSAPSSFPPALAQPNVVPTTSLWTQLALIGLMAGLGVLLIGSRRQ